MKRISILLIAVLAIFAVNFAFAAETEMSVYISDISQGQTAHVNITLPIDALGEVSVSVNGQEYRANVVDGKATVNLTGLNAGEYKVLVTYEGNGNYSEVSKEVNLTVSDASSQTTANASGESLNVTESTPTNVSGENITNDTNNTNRTPTEQVNKTTPVNQSSVYVNNTTVVNQSNEQVNNTTVVKQPPKQPPKSPLSELAKIPTGIPIVLLIIVIIGIVFGVNLRKK